jgi:hypothetical protein
MKWPLRQEDESILDSSEKHLDVQELVSRMEDLWPSNMSQLVILCLITLPRLSFIF